MNTPKKMIFEDSVSSNHKENKLSYDDAFKRFFSRKAVLAVLLREIIPDYHDLSISEIEELIISSRINQLNAETLAEEDVIFGSKIMYDVVIQCALPDTYTFSTMEANIIFDLEMQRKYQMPYKAGKDAIVEVIGDNSIVATGCPLQASGTLTIKGSGTLTLECSEGMQACIGTETHTGMSYGRWEPGRWPSLNKIIVDGVKVDCHSRVLNFSIGSYGESEVPEIECINGGSLNCPEINGKRIMNRSGAEGLCGSTKRENCAEYKIVTDVHDEPQKMLL